MPFFAWDEKYQLGVSDIDDQHKRLVEMIGDLHEAMSAGKGSENIGPLIADLADYAATHFSTEERLMIRFKYPHLAEHKAEHEAFIAKVADFRKRYAQGKTAVAVEVMAFLRTWLVDHFLGTDKQYIPYFEETPIT